MQLRAKSDTCCGRFHLLLVVVSLVLLYHIRSVQPRKKCEACSQGLILLNRVIFPSSLYLVNPGPMSRAAAMQERNLDQKTDASHQLSSGSDG